MLHELILALNGFPGELFHYDGSHFQIRVPKEFKVPLLHPSEWDLVTELLEIGADFKELADFIQNHQLVEITCNLEDDQESNLITNYTPSRSYTSSVCHGMETMLRKYVRVLADFELTALNDPFITLTHVRSVCEPFRSIFQTLHKFMNQIKTEQSSTLILDSVKGLYDNNVHHREELLPLVTAVNQPLLKHITNWVVYGSLPDPNPEFFIQVAKDEPDVCSDTGMNRTGLRTTRRRVSRYFINYSLVPAYFSAHLLERILFMGTSVLILEKSDKTKQNLSKEQKGFLDKMKVLPRDTFRTEDLSETIQNLTLAVGKDLHRLIVTDADLMSHLLIIKDFYLGGRGELWHGFLTNIYHSLQTKMAVTDTKLLSMTNIRLDVKECFSLAAGRVHLEEDIVRMIEIVVTPDPTKPDAIGKYLSQLSLQFKLEWPLHILFSPESMAGYNDLFRFLLHVRRIQIQLKSVWVETKAIFRIPIPRGPALLRINMTHFVNNFQYYLQVDVLENQFGILTETIGKNETFDGIRIALAKFQANVMVQSFRTNPVLVESIDQMLSLCEKFSKHMDYLLEKYHGEGVPVCEGRSEVVDGFTMDFNRRLEFLYAAFRRLAGGPQFGLFLGQFLLRLDYNFYFTKAFSLEPLEQRRSTEDPALPV